MFGFSTPQLIHNFNVGSRTISRPTKSLVNGVMTVTSTASVTINPISVWPKPERDTADRSNPKADRRYNRIGAAAKVPLLKDDVIPHEGETFRVVHTVKYSGFIYYAEAERVT